MHKLLGDKFKVRPWQLLHVLNLRACPLPACVCEPTGAEALLQLAWETLEIPGSKWGYKAPIRGWLT